MGDPIQFFQGRSTGGSTHEGFWSGLFKSPGTAAFMAFSMIVIVGIMFSIGLVWGLSMMIGIILIIYAGAVIILNRGSHVDTMTLILIGLGCFFIFLHTVGVTFGVVDFSNWEIPRAIFNFFHPM